jgi:histidinol-phosphatase
MNADLALALALADAADEITMRWFRSSALNVRTKADLSPVSAADEEVERTLRERLQRERPDDGIVGEEYGVTGTSPRQWILDPIDGTKNYVRGVPVFGTLIALAENGRSTVGVVSAPALSRRWWASAGGGAFCNGAALRVSRTERLEEAFLSIDFTDEPYLSLARRCGRTRGFGDFWAHMLVAEGAIDITAERPVSPWDMAAVQIIVEEAGGRFTDLQGNARFDGGSGMSTNGLLHDAVLECFR